MRTHLLRGATDLRRRRVRSTIADIQVWGGVIITVVASATAVATPVDSLRVMTFNILGGAGLPAQRFVDVIEAAQADVIGFQETGFAGGSIAAAIGFYHHQFNSDLGIASRYPITEILIGGVKLELSPGQEVYVYDVHLPAFPYQPYGIRDGTITTEAQAIAQAQTTRGIQVANRINHLAAAPNASPCDSMARRRRLGGMGRPGCSPPLSFDANNETRFFGAKVGFLGDSRLFCIIRAAPCALAAAMLERAKCCARRAPRARPNGRMGCRLSALGCRRDDWLSTPNT